MQNFNEKGNYETTSSITNGLIDQKVYGYRKGVHKYEGERA